jgi:hypothetical protein
MQINTPLNKVLIPSQNLIEAVQATESIKPVQTVTSDAGFYPGKIINATITQRLNADRLLATLDGQPYDLYLPKGTIAEKSLTLQVVSTEPKLLFKLIENAQEEAGTPESNVELSNDIQIMKSMLTTALRDGKSISTPAQEGPLLQPTKTYIDTSQAAEALQTAVNKSGYFYESHQALWINDKYPLETLKQESDALSPKTLHETKADQNNLQTAQSTQNAQDRSPSLVERQLAMVVGSPIEWQGQAWPGQPMYLSVQRDKDANPFIDPVEKGWNSELKLDLPNLGAVEAKLRFSKGGVAMSINTSKASSSDLLKTSSKEFIDTLEALNIKIVTLGIKHNE